MGPIINMGNDTLRESDHDSQEDDYSDDSSDEETPTPTPNPKPMGHKRNNSGASVISKQRHMKVGHNEQRS